MNPSRPKTANLSPISAETAKRVTDAEKAIAEIDRLNAEIGAVIDMARPAPPPSKPQKKGTPQERKTAAIVRIETARLEAQAASARKTAADLKIEQTDPAEGAARIAEATARIMEYSVDILHDEADRSERFLQTLRQAAKPADDRFDPAEPAIKISYAYYHAPVSPPPGGPREAVELQLAADLDAAIAAEKARSYWTCGGCRVPHRSRRTANDCQHAGKIIMRTQEIPSVARFAHYDRVPKP